MNSLIGVPDRIAVIGNGGGGKTTLSRALAARFDLPLTHVDSIQFLSGMKTRDRAETGRILNEIADTPRWLIDGFGSMEVMTRRFELADKIVFVDFPLWRHYWWCTKRQVKSIWAPRSELPEGCNEATVPYSIELAKTLWRVHTKIRPELIKVFSRPEIAGKVVRITKISKWNEVYTGN